MQAKNHQCFPCLTVRNFFLNAYFLPSVGPKISHPSLALQQAIRRSTTGSKPRQHGCPSPTPSHFSSMYWFHRPLAPTQLRRKHIFSAMHAAARAAARSVLVQRWSRSDRSLRKAPCSVVVDRPCRFTRSVCVCVGASEREVHYATRVLLCRFGACGRVRVCVRITAHLFGYPSQ